MCGTLTIANVFLRDFSRLNAHFHDDGYLFFRKVLDLALVARVKSDFLDVLQAQGIARAGQSEPVWTGPPLEQIDDDVLYGLNSYNELIESDAAKRERARRELDWWCARAREAATRWL